MALEQAEHPPPASACAHALAGLGERDREVLILAAWEGLAPHELAVVLGCRPNTARVRLHRARRRFAALLPSHTPEGRNP